MAAGRGQLDIGAGGEDAIGNPAGPIAGSPPPKSGRGNKDIRKQF
jgi:hypothetical protein